MLQENKTDLRIIRTKDSIRDALLGLMEEKSFEMVTVKDITTRAKINRGTFYAHYQDKYELITKWQEEILTDLSLIVKEGFPDVVTKSKSKNSLPPFNLAIAIFEYINENASIMKTMLDLNGDLSFQDKIKNYLWNTLVNKTSFLKEEECPVPTDYLSSYIASAHMGVIQKWIQNGRKESPQEMAHILTTLNLNGPLFAAGLKNK